MAVDLLPLGGFGGFGAVTRSLLLGGVVVFVAYLAQQLAALVARVRRMRKIIDSIPGPPGLPVIGNVLDVLQGDQTFENVQRIMAQYGPTVRMWLGTELCVCISDPRDVEFICTSTVLTDKSSFYDLLVPFLGKGLSTLSGEAVRRHRKIIVPSLHLDILHDFLHVFQKRADMFAKRLEVFADTGEVFNVSPLCMDMTVSSVLQTIMSTDIQDEESKTKYRDTLLPCMEMFMYRVTHPWLLSDAIFRFTTLHRETKQHMHTMNSFCEKVIGEKRQQLAREDQEHKPLGRRQAFLDNILRSKDGAALTDVELRDEVKTILATGTETTASTMSFLFQILALRQDVQDKLMQELDDVFGNDPNRPVTNDELPHLRYMETVIKETLRMFPVLPYFTRHAPYDVLLPSGHTVPEGAHIVFVISALHMNPAHFPEPEKFDPDRFLLDNSRQRHPFSYVPFSAGPRNCVGQRYAMLNLKTQLATLLRRFRVLPAPGQEGLQLSDVPVRITLTIQVRGGVNIRLQKRLAQPA